MKKLSIDDILSNESYQAQRPAIRQAIMEHKTSRRVALGPNLTLHFEDFMTMRYQVQELIRVEKISDISDIRQELDAYNPLIPDGSNLKVTMMIEYPDENERKRQLAKLIGIENKISIKIGQSEPVFPIANEDLERSTDEKTSAVHFLRFEFPDSTIDAAKNGEPWSVRCEHEHYEHVIDTLPEQNRTSLLRDFT